MGNVKPQYLTLPKHETPYFYGPPEQGDDGVVKYTSAHIGGVDSELIVRDSQSTQATPETIEEMRRILYVHLKGQ